MAHPKANPKVIAVRDYLNSILVLTDRQPIRDYYNDRLANGRRSVKLQKALPFDTATKLCSIIQDVFKHKAHPVPHRLTRRGQGDFYLVRFYLEG